MTCRAPTSTLFPYTTLFRSGVGRDADGGGEYSAILYRKSRFEVLDQGTFWLSQTPDQAGSAGWDAVLPRIATYGRFEDKNTGKKFTLLRSEERRVGKDCNTRCKTND